MPPRKVRTRVSIPAELRKAHEAIFVRPVRGGRLELLKRKAYNALLHHAQRVGVGEKEYTLSIGELAKSCSFGSNNYDVLKDYLRELQGTQVEWGFTTDKGSEWGVSSLLSRVELRSHGEIVYAFDEKMKIRLLDPVIFSKIDMRMMAVFRSSYSLSLYEACTRWRNNPSGLSGRWHWTIWRAQVCGEESALYDEFKYFNSRVLKKAIAEINAVSDLTIEMNVFREGRTVSELQFRIQPKKQTVLELDAPPQNMDLRRRLKELGLHEIQIADLLGSKEESVIEAALEFTENRIKNRSLAQVENPVAYFINAVNSNLKTMQKQIDEDAAATRKAQRTAEEAARLRGEFNNKRLNDARLYFSALDEAGKADQLTEFGKYLRSTKHQVSAAFRKSGIDTPMVAATFYGWLATATWGEPNSDDLLSFALEQRSQVEK